MNTYSYYLPARWYSELSRGRDQWDLGTCHECGEITHSEAGNLGCQPGKRKGAVPVPPGALKNGRSMWALSDPCYGFLFEVFLGAKEA